MKPAPIALFVYNRPQHARRTVDALVRNELAAESELFVYSDGPRDTDESRASVTEVRRYLPEIQGFRKIHIRERSTNLGLAESIIRGVTELVENYGKVIVLEDDLITAPCFLHFMNSALERYEADEKVMQVTGYMFDVDLNVDTDAIFLPFISSWGWATWKRAWEYFDPAASGYKELQNNRRLQRRFNLDGAYDYFSMLKAHIRGNVDSWAIRWYLSVFMLDGLALYPAKSLVENIGFDGSGTHCESSAARQKKNIDGRSQIQWCNFPRPVVEGDIYNVILQALSSKSTIKGKLRKIYYQLARGISLVSRIF